MAGMSLRSSLDRDVYQILKKLEDANDGKPFKSVIVVYDAIKRSNSSLSRQKKRPLEDSIDRVLQYRKQELADSDDSEAALDEPEPAKPEDDRFLINRQMTKLWHQDTDSTGNGVAQAVTASEGRALKKRRLQDDREERASGSETAAQANPNGDALSATMPEKLPAKKQAKSRRYEVEHPRETIRLGGVTEVCDQLLRQTSCLLKRPECYTEKTWRRVPGIVLSGPSGTGKKSLIRLLATKLEVPIVSLTGCFDDPERMEKSLNDAIEEAMRLAPCIIFIEQLDWYMAKPGATGHTEHHHRNLTHFIRQMRRIEQDQPRDRNIIAMTTTSQITDVHPRVLKTGLFERTIQMRIPDLESRKDIFKVLTDEFRIAEDFDFAELAKITHGFVGEDIVNVVTLAQQVALERFMDSGLYQPFPDADGTRMNVTNDDTQSSFVKPPEDPVTLDDFKRAIKGFTPSLRKEGFTVIPNVTWDQVGALKDVREQLDMSVIGPIQNPEQYRRFGLNRPGGCLLWGPPGCGKTLVAQAVANEAQASFILINGPELLNKYVGESERAVRELFNRARSSTPCILFFDEMDSIVPKRDGASTEVGARIVNAFLTELDGVQDRAGVYVIGTTNRPDMIDAAMLRPGRLSVSLLVDLPTPDERVDILRAIYRTAHPSATESELMRLDTVARDSRCTDFSGADLGGLHIKAAESALKRWRARPKDEDVEPEIGMEDWERALTTTERSVTNPASYRRLGAKLGKAS